MSMISFGTVYLIEQGRSFEEIERDLDNIQRMGFNTITLWPVANSWLASTPDEFVFGDTLRVLDLCAARSLRTIMQLIGQNQSQEYMPDCKMKPDMLAMHPKNCFWANPNHPEVDARVYKFFSKAIPAIRDHPAVFAWDVFNEARLVTDDSWTTQLYREWLRKRYGTIKDLNYRWHRRFSCFDQINPEDRNAGYSLWSSLLPGVEYERFRSENLTAICARYVNYAKEFDSEHPIIVDGLPDAILSPNLTSKNSDDFALAKTCDIYGATFYPKSWGIDLYKPRNLSLYYCLSASAASQADRDFYINEIQTHTTSPLSPGSEVSSERLASWVWAGFAAGARGLQLWRWRPFLHGYQSTGRGVTHIDGTPGARAKSMQDIARVLNRHAGFFEVARPLSPVIKIVSSYRSRLFFDAFLSRPKPIGEWAPSFHPKAIAGWYRLAWSCALPTAFCELADLSEVDLQTPVLILPSLVSVGKKHQELLAGYVRSGGVLIADARCATVDGDGVVPSEGIPGALLSEVFGFKEVDVDEPVSFNYLRELCPGSFMSQIIEPTGRAEVLGQTSCGRPMVISNQFGEGRAIYFADFRGLAMDAGVSAVQQQFLLEQVLRVAGCTPWAEKSEEVSVSFHQSENRNLAYVINMGNRSEEVTLHNAPADRKFTDLVTEQDHSADTAIQMTLAPWQCRVLAWE